MFTKIDPSIKEKVLVEPMCYDADHIEEVTAVISEEFESYFVRFIDTEAGSVITCGDFDALQKVFRTTGEMQKSKLNRSANFRAIISAAIDDFEKDKQKYIDLFDGEMLEEYEEDPSSFKSTALKKDCPIIRKTLNSNAKELKKYQVDFSLAKPQELLRVIENISDFSKSYYERARKSGTGETEGCTNHNLAPLDKDDRYTVYGVIGGGIKSHMMFKNYPSHFANRSQSAIWALYFLSKQKNFGCRMDSEFLMIDTKKITTQQNYFYPYELFSYYADVIYDLICNKAVEYDVHINPDYKYVIVDCFMNYVADEHRTHINILKSQIKEGGYGYAYA